MKKESTKETLAFVKDIFDCAIDLNKSLTKVHPLAAIWLSKPVWLERTKSGRIEAGDRLRIENNSIVDIVIPDKQATHQVIGCYGNISDTILYFELMDLQTSEITKLDIKQ